MAKKACHRAVENQPLMALYRHFKTSHPFWVVTIVNSIRLYGFRADLRLALLGRIGLRCSPAFTLGANRIGSSVYRFFCLAPSSFPFVLGPGGRFGWF